MRYIIRYEKTQVVHSRGSDCASFRDHSWFQSFSKYRDALNLPIDWGYADTTVDEAGWEILKKNS